jgi:hypothetical protein
VNVPETWAPKEHVLREPGMWPILAGTAELITDLETAAPEGLDGMRRRFRDLKRADIATAVTQLLDARFEMLVASQLVRAGALRRIRSDTPDFDCRWDGADLGVEATTRAREEIGSALERVMEQGQWGDADVHVTLTRTGKLLFSEAPEVIAETSDQVITQIIEAVAVAGDKGLRHGNIPIPEFGLNATWTSGANIGFPGARVAYEPTAMFTQEEWEYHWKMASMQVKDTIEGKGKKKYAWPSIAVVDISRLGETSRLLDADGIARYQQTLDECNLGNLQGALLVRTTLASQVIEPLCARIENSAQLAALVVQLIRNPSAN